MKKFPRVLLILCILGLGGCGALALINLYMVRQSARRMDSLNGFADTRADCILVLGARVWEDGRLSQVLKDRVDAAIALYKEGCAPKLLIADEPTTALDVTIQAQIMDLLVELKEKINTAIILITHDLGVVATLCDKVVVMYGGLIMEDGTAEDIFYHPQHPYTMGLIDSIPRVTGGEKQRLKPIPGTPPNLINPPKGCPFSARCPYCMNVCTQETPPYFQEDGHRTMCWLLHEEAPENPDYEKRKGGTRRADG